MAKKKKVTHRRADTGLPCDSEGNLTPEEQAAQDAASPRSGGRRLRMEEPAMADGLRYLLYFVELHQKGERVPLTIGAIVSNINKRYGSVSRQAVESYLDRRYPGVREALVNG